jgi:hypothetical protein
MNGYYGFPTTFVALLALGLYVAPAQAQNGVHTVVAPINSTPEGQTYGRWAAQWEQWAIAIPAAENPALDPDGRFCGQRQVDKVWFLAGILGSGERVRTCNIPAQKALFFPLINNAYFAFGSDPPEQRTEEFVRSQAQCTQPAQIYVTIDGQPVAHPERFFTGPSGSQSPIFNVQLPPAGSIFGADQTLIPELLLSPSAEQGYYLFLYPMRPGTHTIHWVATGCTPGGSQIVTYNLTVAK